MEVTRKALANLNIANPLVAWLVYRGEMVSSAQVHEQAVGFWLMRALSEESATGHRSAVFQDELALDALRAAHHPDAISRLRGFYLFDDEPSAARAVQRWGTTFSRDALAEVGVIEGSRWSRHDAQWITAGIGGSDRSWMLPYLRGDDFGAEPVWELIVDGRAAVFGTRLRDAAYEVVKRTWPGSLALLELSRVAVELESDLGLISPMVLGTAGDDRVDFAVNFCDAEDQDFLERYRRYDGPKNTADLCPGAELVVPDLQPHSFS